MSKNREKFQNNKILSKMTFREFSPFIFCLIYVGLRMSGIKYEINVLFLIDEIFNFFLDKNIKNS